MKVFAWTETTADWVTKVNPYRRHEGFCEASQVTVRVERSSTGSGWGWLVAVPHQTGDFWLPRGDLPDDEAKRLAPAFLAAQMRRLAEGLE